MRELIYRKIAGKIKDDIKSGTLAAGARLPGVRELAAQWQTSANTVLKALEELSEGGYIRKTRGQGIFVESGAAKPEGSAPSMLEFRAWSLDVPFNRQLLSAVEKAAGDSDFRLSVQTSETGDEISRIIIPERVPDSASSAGNGKAAVYIGEFSPPHDFKGSYLCVDAYGGFRTAAEMLLSAGRERIAYIGATGRIEDEPGWNAVRDLLSGTANGFNREYSVSAMGWDAEVGRDAMEQLLLGGEFPDGVLCCNDTLAAGAYQACRAAGLNIPDDIAIIGAGNQEIAALLEPPLTSLKLPVTVMGRTAVSYIEAVEAGRIDSAERLRARLDMEIVMRGSVPAGGDDTDSDGLSVDEAWL